MIRDRDLVNALTDTVARFVRERLMPSEEQVAAEDQIPENIQAEMRELGLFGLTIPEEYGGLGLTMEEEVLVAFELGQTSPAFRSLVGTNNGIGSLGIIVDGREEQREKFLPKLASGELVAAFALTEPGSGSDAASLATTAVKDGDHYVLNGTKRYITNGPHAGLFTVFARTDPSRKGASGISAFLIERGVEGMSTGAPDRKMGQKGAHSCDVMFDDCRIPASSLLGETEGVGFRTAMKTLDRGRLHIASVCVGIAERLIRDALTYAMEREQFGKPVAEFQLVQAMLADCRTEAYAAKCMVLETARKRDEGIDVTLDASCCKLFATEMVGRVADKAVQIHGGAGYMQEYAVERFYRDVRLFRIYEGTSQIQQLVIARNMIKEAA